MRRAFALLVLLSLMCLAEPAIAQQVRSAIPGPSDQLPATNGILEDATKPNENDVAISRMLARCLVSHRREQVFAYLSAPSSVGFPTLIEALKGTIANCLAPSSARNFQLADAVLRGSLAEYLVISDAKLKQLISAPDMSPNTAWFSSNPNQRVVEEMSVCIIGVDLVEALKLVRSAPNTSDEARAFEAITPAIGPCLIRGAILRANRTGVRLALASAVYHRMIDTSDAGSSEAKK